MMGPKQQIAAVLKEIGMDEALIAYMTKRGHKNNEAQADK